MIATHEAVYQRLVVSSRESARHTLEKSAAVDRGYSSGGSSGSVFQEQNDLTESQRQYTAAGKGWQYSAIRPVAVAVAKQPVKVGTQKAKKSTAKQIQETKSLILNAPYHIKALVENLEIQNVHPFIDVIERPNPYMVQWGLKYCTAFSIEATGKAYWLLNKVRKSVEYPAGLQLYYLPAHWVYPAIGKNTGKQIGWFIRPPGEAEGEPVPMGDIVKFSYPDASDPGASFSTLQSQAAAINTDDKIQTAQYRSMENGIHPGMVVIAGKMKSPTGEEYVPELTPDQRRTLISTIQGAMRGVMHFNDPIILDGMIEDVRPYTRSAAEMAFLEGSTLTQKRIMQGIGTNPIVAGQIEDANRASSFVAHEGFYRLKVNPLLSLIGETCTQFIAPRFGKRLYIWFEEAQARDEDLHFRQMMGLAGIGGCTVNEIREAFGLAPVAGGDALIPPRKSDTAGRGRPNST